MAVAPDFVVQGNVLKRHFPCLRHRFSACSQQFQWIQFWDAFESGEHCQIKQWCVWTPFMPPPLITPAVLFDLSHHSRKGGINGSDYNIVCPLLFPTFHPWQYGKLSYQISELYGKASFDVAGVGYRCMCVRRREENELYALGAQQAEGPVHYCKVHPWSLVCEHHGANRSGPSRQHIAVLLNAVAGRDKWPFLVKHTSASGTLRACCCGRSYIIAMVRLPALSAQLWFVL